ncbi:MAG: hypothetical protein NTW33_06350, partial [Methanoregula sp.]|nr:hypothetical protein [Methanoregula sp.]
MDVVVLINTSIFACQGKKVSALFLGNFPRMDVHILAVEKSPISHHYQRSMMNQFSTDIARGAA